MKWHRTVFRLITVLLVIAILEGIGVLLMHLDSDTGKIRACLRGQDRLTGDQYCISQAYLNYVPAPGLWHSGFLQHNMHGYRGDSVPLIKTPGVKRILFLGGSVVYGWGVANPAETFPAQCRMLLEDSLHQRVEVLNGGAPFATTAELLNYYLLKFRYYKPDLVVINEGGNDAEAIDVFPSYHPDYSNWRKSMNVIRPLPAFSRFLMRSRLISWLVIRLFYSEYLTVEVFVHDDVFTPAHWFPERTLQTLQPGEYAYENNLGTLVREVLHDSAQVILMEWAVNPRDASVAHRMGHYAFTAQVMRTVAEREGVTFIPFPQDKIAALHWADDCHLNAEGERIKAAYLLPALLKGLD